MRVKAEVMQEREQALMARYSMGDRYVAAQLALGWDSNRIYAVTGRLLKQNKIRRVGKGKYEVVNGASARMEPPIAQAEPPLSKAVAVVLDSEFLATELMGTISKLQPLLALHKHIFDDIQEKAMALIGAIAEEKERLLSPHERDEWRELKALKQEAVRIRDKKFPPQTNREEKRRC